MTIQITVQTIIIALPSLGLIGAFVYLLLRPEQIEILASLFWKFISWIVSSSRLAKLRYIKHDLQGRSNNFARKLRKNVPSISDEKLKIEWIDTDQNRQAFISSGHIVLRLRKDDPEDQNFVHGSLMYISTVLLNRTKYYLSKNQKEAVDIFVCHKMLSSEKPHILGFFMENYVFCRTDSGIEKIKLYIQDFNDIDSAGLYFPIFLQELDLIGTQMIGNVNQGALASEVNRFIDFLKPIATRNIGDDNDLNFFGQFCSVAIVLVGRPRVLHTSIGPYVGYIDFLLRDHELKTIYLISRRENLARIREVAAQFADRYDIFREIQYVGLLRYEEGIKKLPQNLIVLFRRQESQ